MNVSTEITQNSSWVLGGPHGGEFCTSGLVEVYVVVDISLCFKALRKSAYVSGNIFMCVFVFPMQLLTVVYTKMYMMQKCSSTIKKSIASQVKHNAVHQTKFLM